MSYAVRRRASRFWRKEIGNFCQRRMHVWSLEKALLCVMLQVSHKVHGLLRW